MMEELLRQLPQWAQSHPLVFGGLIFVIAFLESLAIVGVLVPGVVVMFAAGALIAAGGMGFGEGVAWAATGAISGDLLSYWLGRRYRRRLLAFWPFCRYPGLVDGGVSFFQRHGGWSVAFGRFVGPVRATIPLVAGMMGMPAGRFLVVNILSGLAWAVVYLLPGVVFALSLELAAAVAWRLALLLVLLVGGMLVLLWGIRRLFHLATGRAKGALAWSLGWAGRHPGAGRLVTALTDPAHPEASALSVLSLVLLLGAILFFLVLGAVAQWSGIATLDGWLSGAVQALRTPFGDQLMAGLTRIADGPLVTLWVASLALVAWWRGEQRLLGYWAAALAFAFLASWVLKFAIGIPRPQLVVSPPLSPAFPSGHTMNAVVAFGFWAVVQPAAGILPRWSYYLVAGVLATAVAFSRIYLGVHWPSDVLASLALGSAWVALLGIAYHCHGEAHGGLGWSALPLLLGLWLLWVGFGGSRVDDYQPYRETGVVRGQVWEQGLVGVPLERHAGDLQLRFAGDLDWLAEELIAAGWGQSEPFRPRELMQRLSPQRRILDWPVVPRAVDGRYPDLTLIRGLAERERLVMRWWRGRTTLMPSGEPIWWGEMVVERERRYLDLLGLPMRERVGLARLASHLAVDGSVRVRWVGERLLLNRRP